MVKGISDSRYNACEFRLMRFYLTTTDKIIAHINREIHIVDQIDAKILLDMDIAVPEGFIIDLEKEKLLIPHCQSLMAKISTRCKVPASSIQVYAAHRTDIPSMISMLVTVIDSNGKRFCIPMHEIFYEPYENDKLTAYPGLIKGDICKVVPI